MNKKFLHESNHPSNTCNLCGKHVSDKDWNEGCPKGNIEMPVPPIDYVNHPAHYTDGKIEHCEYAKDRGWLVDGCLYNASKYLHRCKNKGNMTQDLKKAAWYINYLVKHLEEESEPKIEVNPEAQKFPSSMPPIPPFNS